MQTYLIHKEYENRVQYKHNRLNDYEILIATELSMARRQTNYYICMSDKNSESATRLLT